MSATAKPHPDSGQESISSSSSKSTRKELLDDNDYNEWKAKRRDVFEEKNRIEEDSLNSTKETLGLIVESEKIGVKTGRELIRQRETLNRVEDKLELINGHLDESQKHLKSMKSIFGSFKGYFSKKSDREVAKKCRNDLSEVENDFQCNTTLETIGERSDSNSDRPKGGIASSDSVVETNDTIDYWNKSIELNDKIEQNLNDIDLGVERLKQLSLSLGNEIDSQNCLIDRVTKESERAELRVKDQNQQMNQLLKK